MWITLLVAALVVGAYFAATRISSPRVMPQVGTEAPEFSLPSQDGPQISLKDYRGKWVVLYFYPKDFTSGCTVEAHNFQRDLQEYEKRNAVILGVSVDSADSHKKFCAREGLNFKLLADTSRQVSKEYGSLMNLGVTQVSKRHTFLIDPKGRIARTFASVNPSRHSDEMLAAIDEFEKSSLGLN